MGKDSFGALSPAQREAVEAALCATFGAAPIGTVTPLGGGATSAAPFKVEVGSRHYMVRVEGTPSPLRNPYQYTSMRMAAAAGIAPPIHYIDEAGRVAVMDFVEQQPLKSYPGGPAALAQALGAVLQRMQATPPFPPFVDYPDIVARLFGHVRRTGLFAAGVLDSHFARLERVSADYAAGLTQLVASHNDCIPSNILFDGKRLWLIDWESAYRNDPLVDISTTLDTLARTPELATILLQAWLGRAPDQALRTRLETVRALTRLYYAGVLLSASAAAGWTAGETDLGAPSVSQLQQAIRDGQITPGTPQTKHILGKMFLASFLTGVMPPGFDIAV